MITTVRENLWQQFGASIDMLKNAIVLWPEELWDKKPKFFYNAYHCLIFLDYYLNFPAERMSSPLPFTLAASGVVVKDAVDDIIPDRIYSKEELLGYLQTCREKCRQVIMNITEENVNELWIEADGDRTFPKLELLIYNMRHVQHHAAQLNMYLRQEINDAPRWVSRAGK